MPLLEATLRVLNDPTVNSELHVWRNTFNKSYIDGFNTIRITNKRPQMVLDVPQIATRIAKLNGARSVQLLLVDGMRFDIGRRVTRRLHKRIGGRAVCVDESILWSALPTVTSNQLHLLSRGPSALREPEPASGRDRSIHRAGSVTTLRRVRIGQRDLVKLDVVEARVRENGACYAQRFPALADEVAAVVARFSESLAPRTLLYLFGDHGFTMESDGTTTQAAQQGGASPEEVLVGGQAWLIGDVSDIH